MLLEILTVSFGILLSSIMNIFTLKGGNKNMAAISIKEYIQKAKQLEVAIFTQKSLMKKHEEHLLTKRPQYPTHRIVKTPSAVRPQYPQPQQKRYF